jgi:hypothetical protein
MLEELFLYAGRELIRQRKIWRSLEVGVGTPRD